MGGRYGGSDAYQDRRPDNDDRAAEQQTIADAVRTVAERQRADGEHNSGHADDSGRSDGQETGNGRRGGDSSGGHPPLTLLRSGTERNSGRVTLQDVDQLIAEYVADQLIESVEQAVDKTDPDDSKNQ